MPTTFLEFLQLLQVRMVHLEWVSKAKSIGFSQQVFAGHIPFFLPNQQSKLQDNVAQSPSKDAKR